jgi:thioredoxin 1
MMTSEELKLITEATFDSEIQKGLVLVDFYADWCGPCRMQAPVLEKLAKELTGKARIVKIDVDAAQKVAAKFQITSIPTLILFKDGKEVGRIVGLKDGETLKQFILSGGQK